MDYLHDTDMKRMFECFFTARVEKGEVLRKHTFPKQACKEKALKQCEKFCFPVKKSGQDEVGQKHQHFTYMLTDFEKNRKYGFCKLTENGKQCYCFLSIFPWFEIFYKILNCVCTIHAREDIETLHSIVEKIYKMPVPKVNDIVNVSTSLTFSVRDPSLLPSIPENRNMMEYVSAFTMKNMMEIFAAFMFERRIIFTSSNLSVLTGCIFAAETLLNPLSWQHIFIPVLHEHIVDYCAAPMPFIVGIHSSIFSQIRDSALTEGVVMVHIDSNIVETLYDDVDNLPGEACSFLRSQLSKPNIAVGTRLSEAFLKTQARIFGDYRKALKFKMGEPIVFDEEKFVEIQKSSGTRSFAEELVQLQTFTEFIDRRLHMLNNGVGFHDTFEVEVSELEDEGDYSRVYKEWLSVTRKGSEFITSMRRQAKSNIKQARKSARQSMKDVKNTIKPVAVQTRPTASLHRDQSLCENILSTRPPRPLPPRFTIGVKVRKFKALGDIEESESSKTHNRDPPNSLSGNFSMPCSKGDELVKNRLLIDFGVESGASYQPQLYRNVKEVQHVDLLYSPHHSQSLPSVNENRLEPLSICGKCSVEEGLPGLCPHADKGATCETSYNSCISSNFGPILGNPTPELQNNPDLPLITFD